MTPGVYITFDVECSMGGAWRDPSLKPVPPERGIWGKFGRRELGLPLIVDILNRNDLAATFFVDPFMDEQGYHGEGEGICRYLLDHGQDVQLHIHPGHEIYERHLKGEEPVLTDDLTVLTPDQQLALIQKGSDRLQQWTGAKPVAFRAGNMAADESTLQQLAAAGLKIDSSYTFAFAGGQCGFKADKPFNGSRWYGDVLELALSGLRQVKVPGLRASKPLDLVGISFEECRDGIERIAAAGCDSVLILHSFSLFKVRNVQYDGGRPNGIVTRRFRRMCNWLARRRDSLPARTFLQLNEAVFTGDYDAKEAEPCTIRRPLRALMRRAIQFVNNFYWT